jgi:hypothetical protein
LLWLYVTGLIGAEMNAVLTRMAEVELVQEESAANETNV